MRITNIRTFLMQAGPPDDETWADDGGGAQTTARNWLFVKVDTDEGITGIGECSGWPRVVETAVLDLREVLLGEDPMHIERLWQKLYVAQMGHGITGTVGAGAIAGIDMALWDIKGKALGTPVWNLLGGLVRDKIPVYAHASNAEAARRLADAGFKAVKTGGVAAPLAKIHALRAALPDDVDLMLDLHGPPWLVPKDAIALGHSLEDYELLFLEEPVAPEDVDGLEMVARRVRTPIAAGERVATIWGWRPLIERRIVDIIQPDTGRSGITQMRKLAAIAEAFNVMVAPHSGSLGPIAEFAAVHVLAATPNALLLEKIHPDWSERERVLTRSLRLSNGAIQVPTEPGLGVDIQDDVVAEFPSVRNVAMGRGGYVTGTSDESVYSQIRRGRASYFKASEREDGPRA